ncbi:transposase [Candidatus Woesearchaeota archaeon]|nr:transposase [Candidatus Woesearchaeota archaeon]
MINLQTRELVLKWDKEGKKQEQIAALVGCDQSSISRLIRKYKKTGSVKNLPRSGRPTPLTKKTLAKLKTELTTKVKAANEHYCSIDTKHFSDLIGEKVKRKYSTRHVRRLLHKLDFSRITPRSKHIKNDPEKVQLFREDFKKNLKRSTWVLKL